jgi:Ca2+/H+ antiporter, TMEM165/GDT1 family
MDTIMAGMKARPRLGRGRACVNPAVIAAVFPVIFLGELPDKTMFASLVMATRGRPFAVWLGATAAFAVHVVIATTAGVVLMDILPHRAVEVAVALTFLAGAAFMVYEARSGEDDTIPALPQARMRRCRSAATAFAVIFLAEWGDLTQVLTVNLAVHYHSALPVGLGAVLALAAVAGIAVAGGKGLLRLVNPTVARLLTAAALLALGSYATVTAFR